MAHKSKKFLQKNCKVAYSVLKACNYNRDQDAYELRHRTGITKQNLNYWLKKLMDEGLIRKRYQGCYEITDDGKKFYETLTKEKNKQLVRLENMRYKCEIHSGLQNLTNYTGWSKVQQLNGMKVYHGKLNGFTVRVFASKNPSLEITCKQWHDNSPYEAVYWAKNDIEIALIDIREKFKLSLGMLVPSMEPEFAIPSRMAEALLTSTASSQIRTPKGTINRSKGRNADLETRDIRLANDIFDMPYRIKTIENDVNEIKMLLLKVCMQGTGGSQQLVI